MRDGKLGWVIEHHHIYDLAQRVFGGKVSLNRQSLHLAKRYLQVIGNSYQMIFNYKISVFLLVVFFGTSYHSQSQELRIDHVITLVSNLDRAMDDFSAEGFFVKPGHLHSNGLINAHIKFNNYSSFELMSIEGDATDKLAKEYESLLKNGDGGVYLALSGLKMDSLVSILSAMHVKYVVSRGKQWSYMTFPNHSELAHLFFIEYHFDQRYFKDVVDHKNGLEKINSVYIEGSVGVIEFLKGVGLQCSGLISDNEFGIGTEFLTNTGNVIVIPKKDLNRSRIKSIVFGKKHSTKTLRLTLD